MVLIASALLAFIGIRYGKAMLVWMGAGVIFDAGFAYLQWYAWLGVFAVLHGLYRPAAQRRATRPHHLDPGGGGVLNVLLDYLLMAVIPWAGGGRHRDHALPGGHRRPSLWHFFTPSQLRIRWDTLVPDWRLMGRHCDSGCRVF